MRRLTDGCMEYPEALSAISLPRRWLATRRVGSRIVARGKSTKHGTARRATTRARTAPKETARKQAAAPGQPRRRAAERRQTSATRTTGSKEVSTTRKTRGKGMITKARAKVAAAAAAAAPTSKRGTTRKAAGRQARSAAQRVHGAALATRLMRIRELDPQIACGPGTTVMQLFRVDDLPVGSATAHLVFFDRHGWYCEHGRDCPAVAAVRKHDKAGTSRR